MRTDPWLLVPEGMLLGGCEIALEPEEARHASGSLRLRTGDRVVLTDGVGSVTGAELTRCVRSDVIAVVDEVVTRVLPLPGPTVALGVLHTKAMDWAVQKAVEVGAAQGAGRDAFDGDQLLVIRDVGDLDGQVVEHAGRPGVRVDAERVRPGEIAAA